MTWKEFKEMVDEKLKEEGREDRNTVIDYIDFAVRSGEVEVIITRDGLIVRD